MGTVIDHLQSVLLRDRFDGFHITGQAIDVRCKDR